MVDGVIQTESSNGMQTDYLFRVSLKALIRNERGEVLVVKEAGRDWWDLPGGGMDHGETFKQAIARELEEEVGLKGDFSYRPIAVNDPAFLERANVMQMRIIFHVEPENYEFETGVDADEVAFMSPDLFKDSGVHREKDIFDFSLLV